jgi:DNA-binding SARP family transcriptional activator
MRVQINLLGQFQVIIDQRAIPAEAWRRERGAAVVKLLALAPGRRLHREQAMEALWPDMAEDAAGANLRKAVHFARRSLGAPELISMDGEVVALAPDRELVLDTEVFSAAANAALSDPETSRCARAADLYGGELLPDDRYISWVEQPREQLRLRYARLLKTGKLWERALALDPTDEQAQCALMQGALDAGNRGEAIRLFENLRNRLRLDLGVGPCAAAVALYERALQAPSLEPSSVTDRVRGALGWGLIHLHGGDFAKAESIARETRSLALGAGLAREVGEASSLLGLTLHMQGRWRECFRSEFTTCIRNAPTFSAHVFDGHLCLSEFALSGRTTPWELGESARELLSLAEAAGSGPGRGLAFLRLGEVELILGHLDEAEQQLAEAERLFTAEDAVAARVLSLERLAEIAIIRGQRWHARRLIQRGLSVAAGNWMSPHLLIRLHARAVQAAATPEDALERVENGDQILAAGGVCHPCSLGFLAASAIVLAEAGELEKVGRRLQEAERLAGMWNGGPWVAVHGEARGVFHRASGHEDRAQAAFVEAAARFAELGRSLDQARCLARIARTGMPQAHQQGL